MKTSSPRRVALTTLGCKLNTYETKGIAELLFREGFREVPFTEAADLYVINTCTVTGRADHSSRQMVRRAIRLNPNAQVVVVGCGAQRDPASFAAIAGVDLVLGNREKIRFAEHLDVVGAGAKQPAAAIRVSPLEADSPFEDLALTRFRGYTRAFLKIQEGCDFACTFCIIPSVRGASRSMPPGLVVDRIARLVDEGYSEVVLSGVLMGSYGRDLKPRLDLAGLVERILGQTRVPRIRLSSLLPTELTPALQDLLAGESRICKHLHLPLQSGDNRILRAMRRPYKRERYAALVTELRTRIPNLGLGIDVIVGFPGEDDASFATTVDFIESLPVTYLHVFSYSRRDGTKAAALDGQVPQDVIQRRNLILRDCGRRKAREFAVQQVGTTTEAMIFAELDATTGMRKALTHNYLQVLLPAASQVGLAQVDLVGIRGRALLGSVGASTAGRAVASFVTNSIPAVGLGPIEAGVRELD